MRSRTCAEHHIRQSFTRFSPSDLFSAEQVGGFLATATPFHTWRHQLITRTTRTPAFWGYPRRLMITHTIESYWIPSQKMTKSKLQILKIRQNYTRHTFWSCLIRCANMKWIRWELLKIQSGHDSVHRWTDRQGDTSIPPYQLHWSGGYNQVIFIKNVVAVAAYRSCRLWRSVKMPWIGLDCICLTTTHSSKTY